jgi:hypothetical protein
MTTSTVAPGAADATNRPPQASITRDREEDDMLIALRVILLALFIAAPLGRQDAARGEQNVEPDRGRVTAEQACDPDRAPHRHVR